MPSWSTRWFFFLVFGFALYVIARGDGPQWKKIFTQSMGSAKASTPAASSTSTTNPATNSALAASGNTLAQSLTGAQGQLGIDSGTWDDGTGIGQPSPLPALGGLDTGTWD